MSDSFTKVVNKYLMEQDEDETNDVIKVFYADLDLDARRRVLEGIDNSDEYINVFEDDMVKEKIEQELMSKPILLIRGEELVKKMNIDF